MFVLKKDIFPFLAFFLITIGNGTYINYIFGDKVELIGLVLLTLLCIFTYNKRKKGILIYLKITFLSILLSLGCYLQVARINIFFMVFSTSLIIMTIIYTSDYLIDSNRRIKLLYKSLLYGIIFTIVIGALTGTLGLSFDSKDSIFGIIFLAGFQVKNYCGGLWMLLIILHYIYCNNTGKKNSKKNFYVQFLLFVLLILSGSKAAILLSVFFLILNNNNINMTFLKKNRFSILIISIFILILGIYLYKNVLSNVDTYVFRMKGLQKLFEIMKDDSNRFWFGFSDIAYADTGLGYTYNMRNFLGWEASVEMAYVNILIKNGIVGMIVYLYVYLNLFKTINRNQNNIILIALFLVVIISGFVETYIVSIHYVIGPILYCILKGLINYNYELSK